MPFATIDACFVCELVRPEPNGKFSVLGYYGIATHVYIQIQNFGLPVGLTFVFAGGPGAGHFRISLRITAPNGATFDTRSVEIDMVEQAKITNIFLGFHGALPGPGEYTATLLVDDAEQFQTRFTLAQMPMRGLPPLPTGKPN